MTYYQAGLGACGITSNGDVEIVVALSSSLMGYQSNSNPYCGKHIKVINGMYSIVATVVDKCPSCQGYSIDLSKKAFLELGEPLAVGQRTVL